MSLPGGCRSMTETLSDEPRETNGQRQIVLVGAPGSGKTTVGTLLAESLGLPFVDVDARIVETAGKLIAEIFADEGEPVFRELEAEHTADALTEPGVISLGGGAVVQERVRALLAGRTVVWLVVSASEAAGRVGLNQARPLLLGNVRATLVRLLNERTPVYRSVASIEVATDHLTPEQVRDRILEELKLLKERP